VETRSDRQPDGSEEVRRLFHEQIPEVANGIVEIEAIARARSYRTLVAVRSKDAGVDPVGACVGSQGALAKGIVQRLGGEKLDIIRWSASVEEFIGNTIAPARAERIDLNSATHSATLHVRPEYIALTLGREQLRLHLMSRLVGWAIQVTAAAGDS
jgi:N utilization substance protein A